MDPAVDLVIAGHTHDEFICEIGGKWVTMADNAGRLFTVIDATLRRSTGDITVQTAKNLPNSQAGTTPVPVLTALNRQVRRAVGAQGQRRGRHRICRHHPAAE